MKPIRTCIVCKGKFDKNLLNRLVKADDGKIVLDAEKTVQKRSCYICLNKNCHEKMFKTKALNRAFKQNVLEQNYAELAKILKYE